MNVVCKCLKRIGLMTLIFTLLLVMSLFTWHETPSADTDRVAIACVN